MLRFTTVIFFFLFAWKNVLAQEDLIRVTGKVRDTNGEELVGATVKVQGQNIGTIADINGNYSLQVPPDSKLLVTFVGYSSEVKPVNGRTEIDFVLEENVEQLDEVVKIGYGFAKPKELTTATTKVKARDIEDLPVPSLDQAIQGKVAGVQVTKGTGAPGGGINVRIRGTSSIFGGQEPLYIVDGVPINNTFTGSVGQGGTESGEGYAGNEVLNGMANINPDEIESIEILKDAAAASIYGARAANGVVLITTKRGRPGDLQADLKLYSGVTFNPRRYDLLNSTQYAAVLNEGFVSANNGGTVIKEAEFNTDWQDEIFQTAPMQSATLTLSGGTENTQYLFAPSYFRQEGIIINSKFERFSFRTNLDHKFSNNVKIGTNMMISNTISERLRNSGGANVQDAFNNNSVFGPSVLSSALVYSPLVPVRNPATGQYATDSLTFYVNPVALANLNDLSSNGLRLIGNLYGEFSFLENFTARVSLGGDLRDENEFFTNIPPPTAVGGGSVLRRSFRETLWLGEAYINYNKKFSEDFTLDLLAGTSYQRSSNDGFSIGVRDLVIDDILTLAASSQFTSPVSDTDSRFSIASFYSRARFGLKDRYFFNATIRRDGSSKFGLNRRFGTFPSASFAWSVIDEPWLTVPDRILSNLKARVSWGMTGNDQIPPFRYLASLFILDNNYIGQNGAVLQNLENVNYSWETTEQLDIGIDLGFFGDRIQVTSDYFIKTTRDLLLPRPLPAEAGISGAFFPFVNIGDMENRGLELAVTGTVVNAGDFTWDANFNISFIQQKVLDLVDGQAIIGGSFGYANIFAEGEELSFQLYQLEETVDPVTGYRRIKDLNDNGRLDDGDLTILGSPNPDHFGGITNSIKWKNFDANIFFQWVYGNQIINNTRGYVNSPGKPSLTRSGPNITTEALDRWQQEGDEATFPRIDYAKPGFPASSLLNLSRPTDQNLEDGSYIKLRNITIGYNFSPALVQKLKMRKLRAYVTANNMFVLTRYSGFDPEVNHTVTNNIGAGYDNGTYPQPRAFLIGVNMGF